MMDEEIFTQLKNEYEHMEESYKLQIDLCHKNSVKRCFNKGYLLDVLPFEHELSGYKLHKKTLQRMVMENNHMIYYFNKDDKVCLVEEACTFLKKIEYYTLYDYHENYIFKSQCQSYKLTNVSLYFIENGKISEGYFYAKRSHIYEQYVYNGEQLEKIIYTCFEHELETVINYENYFYYNEKNNLKLIQKVHSNGYAVNIYANIKINYKKLKTYLYDALKENILLFFHSHNKESIETLGIRLWMDYLEPMLDINFRIAGDIKFSVSEWSYPSVSNIQITDVPLDNAQQDKIVQLIYGILAELIDAETIQSGIKLKVFFHDEYEITPDKSIKKIIQGKEDFF